MYRVKITIYGSNCPCNRGEKPLGRRLHHDGCNYIWKSSVEIRRTGLQHLLMSVSAETEEGAKEYLLYKEYGDMALYADLGQALQPIFYGIVTQMEIKAIGSRCAVYPETVILSCFIDLMVLFSFISAKNSVAILSNISPDMDSSIMPI